MSALRYNEGKLRWSLVDFNSLKPLVQVLMYGADKYAPDNWKFGLDKREIIDSTIRHLVDLSDGNLYDEESKLLHAGHVLANMMFWIHYHNKDENNRTD